MSKFIVLFKLTQSSIYLIRKNPFYTFGNKIRIILPAVLFSHFQSILNGAPCFQLLISRRFGTAQSIRWLADYGLGQGWRTYGTRLQNGMREDFLGTRHSLLSLISFCLFSPTNISILWRMCVNIHTSDCVDPVYELPLLPNYTVSEIFYTNRERCEVLTGYLSMGRRSGCDQANVWHWRKSFTILFPNRK